MSTKKRVELVVLLYIYTLFRKNAAIQIQSSQPRHTHKHTHAHTKNKK